MEFAALWKPQQTEWLTAFRMALPTTIPRHHHQPSISPLPPLASLQLRPGGSGQEGQVPRDSECPSLPHLPLWVLQEPQGMGVHGPPKCPTQQPSRGWKAADLWVPTAGTALSVSSGPAATGDSCSFPASLPA